MIEKVINEGWVSRVGDGKNTKFWGRSLGLSISL